MVRLRKNASTKSLSNMLGIIGVSTCIFEASIIEDVLLLLQTNPTYWTYFATIFDGLRIPTRASEFPCEQSFVSAYNACLAVLWYSVFVCANR